MHVIKWILLFQLSAISFARAADEYWGIYQFKKDISDTHFLFAEYLRRDLSGYFEVKKFDLFRISYGGKINEWIYLVGAAYVDFSSFTDERRLHQFFIRNINHGQIASSIIRLGLEQRSFISDDELYWRGRVRGQLNVSLVSSFGVSFYDEMLFALNGVNKFYQGFNENRLGVGFRYKAKQIEVLIYHTYATVKTLKTELNQQWIQLQTIFNF